VRQEVWRTDDGKNAMVMVDDNEAVSVHIDLLHEWFTRFGWEQRDAESN